MTTLSYFWKPGRSLNINVSITATYQPCQPSQMHCGRLVLCGNKNLNDCLFTQKKCGLVFPPRVCEPRGGGSRRSAADSYSGPNCPAALCGGSKPEDDKLALSWWECGMSGEMSPRTRWGVGLRSDCPLRVLRVKTLRHTTYCTSWSCCMCKCKTEQVYTRTFTVVLINND